MFLRIYDEINKRLNKLKLKGFAIIILLYITVVEQCVTSLRLRIRSSKTEQKKQKPKTKTTGETCSRKKSYTRDVRMKSFAEYSKLGGSHEATR